MQVKLSKTLRRHLDAGLYEAQRNGNVSIMLDMAFLSLVKEGMSHAGHILRKLLKDWEIYQLTTRIEKRCAQAAGVSAQGIPPPGGALQPFAQEQMADAVAGISGYCLAGSMLPAPTRPAAETAIANSGHFLQWILDNPDLISSQELTAVGVTPDSVAEYLTNMPKDEDYYLDMKILEQLDRPQVLKIQLENLRENPDEEPDVPIRQTKGTGGRTSKGRAKTMLDQFGTNLSIAAARGEIDPVVGRRKEIERLIQILGRRKKNNPILVGEAGVGKSAIVEGLALRLASGDVPQSLRGKEIFSLDIASLVAGTKYRGEFEQRIKALIAELQKNKDIILFIDEIHTIAGAGSTQGSLDTANILKPSLARGELQCIGATTLDEYREHIESDSALERRFQKIIVEPTTPEQTLEILENIKGQYEKHHCVRFSDEALKACVTLTERYITDRQFPDKAIDVLDEAGSKARIFASGEPAAVKELEKALWELEARMVQSGRESSADKLRAMTLREKIHECRSEWQRGLSLHPVTIEESHIEEVITSMTGIPVEKVSQGEKKRLHRMEEHLRSKVIGQDSAVGKVTRSIQRSRTGLKDPNKPIGVFMFVGPTGVGKTHLAKELSKWMFDKPDSLIRVDMSEYSEKHNVSRMIGSPPGYVGYNEGGQLTEAVRRQPYAVILFDEIEKAHPDVFNIMLQIFDEGQLTDGLGRKVDFRNTVIIMTSNVGSRAVANKPKAVGYKTPVKERTEILGKETQYRGALERTFAPEFINRIDDIVIFNTLSSEDIQKIVGLELAGLTERAHAMGYNLNVTPKARKTLAQLGYEPRYGVRSLKRTILDRVEEPIAQLIVGGRLQPGDTIRVESRGQRIEVVRQVPMLKKSC
ncbi:MAG: ATP-dependent Clp protease ATP-binding subunit [Rikenellaceae bacterium]|nr:ATP-dependent Clp protease ATP-binding subunit [Rikenellaceae bacterium]